MRGTDVSRTGAISGPRCEGKTTRWFQVLGQFSADPGSVIIYLYCILIQIDQVYKPNVARTQETTGLKQALKVKIFRTFFVFCDLKFYAH